MGREEWGIILGDWVGVGGALFWVVVEGWVGVGVLFNNALWIGSENGNGGVSFLLAEEWMEKVYDICMISDHLMMIKLAIENKIITVLSCDVPQVGLDNTIKDAFYDLLNSTADKVSAAGTLVICGNFNSHVGKVANGYENVHGGHGYGLRNTEGEHILEFPLLHDIFAGNPHFHKKDNHLTTYHSGGNSSRIDYILRKSDFKQVHNIKVIPREKVVTQHLLLVSDMKWKFVKQTKKKFSPKLQTWKLKNHNVINLFTDRLTHLHASDTNEKSEDKWIHFKTNSPKATKETWWWDKSVNYGVIEKRRLFKIRKKGGSRDEYTLAKKVAKQSVFATKKKAKIKKLKNTENDHVTVFCIAKQMRKKNKDIVSENA